MIKYLFICGKKYFYLSIFNLFDINKFNFFDINFKNYFESIKSISFILLLFFFIFFVIYIIFEWRDIRGKKEKIDFFYKILKKVFIFIKESFSILFILFVILFFVFTYKYISNYIKEITFNNNLIKVIKNLNNERLICEINILRIDRLNEKIVFQIKSYNNNNLKISQKDFEIKGREIYIDFIVVDFEYKFIEEGKKLNIAVLNSLYSNSISPNNGISLREIFYSSTEIYGLDKDNYYIIIKYIDRLIDDKNFRGKEGVRTIFGSSISFIPRHEGDIFRIYVNNIGGIFLEKINF